MDQDETTPRAGSPAANCSACPLSLWLQWDGDGVAEDPGNVAAGEVTWCRDKIFEGDIEYVHAGEVRRALGGHRLSELFGEAGLIAATMRLLDHGELVREAVENLRSAKGRHNAEIAYKRLMECLPNAQVEARRK